MAIRLIVLLFFTLANFAMADEKTRCSESIIDSIREKLNYPELTYRQGDYGEFVSGEQIISGVCKVWPKDINKTIVAIAYYDKGHVENLENLYEEKHYILAIVDSSSSKIISSYQWNDISDIGTSSLSIDTARYDLKPGVRAFALDVSEQYRPHSVNGGLGATRTLFIQNGTKIKPILKNFLLSEWSFVDEQMVSTWPEGDKSTRLTSYNIGLSKNFTNGFRDLEITQSMTYEDYSESGRKLPANSSSVLKILKFNGKEYE